MAIGRVAGPLLFSDLDRQGVDLQFSTNSQPLLYLDFANFRAAINANTLNTTATFTVNGDAVIDGLHITDTTIASTSDITLSAANNVNIGHIDTVKIQGGANNYIMTTDGAGNLSWENLNVLADELDLAASNINLGITTDGSTVDYAAYRYWNEQTSIADAVDNLNQVMLNVYKGTYVGQADFVANVSAGPSPLTVTFSPTNIVGNPTDYLWEFGDGITSTEQNPTHTYVNDQGGQFSVYFKASNPAGTRGAEGRLGDGHLAQGSYADNLKPDFITLYTPIPTAAFVLSTNEIDSGNSVFLTNNSQYGTSYTIHWGDGVTTQVTTNDEPGGVTGIPISHTYTNVAGDTRYQVTLETYSATAGPGGATTVSDPYYVQVYSTHIPQFIANKSSGNNQHATVPHGLVVTFTNVTGTALGETFLFPGNLYRWHWGDGTITDVAVGSREPGDTALSINHAFELDDPKVGQSFDVTLEVINGHSTSPFMSAIWTVTVIPAPTSLFVGEFVTQSDRTGDTAQTGYLFTDLLGNDRSVATFTNSSFNADTFTWHLGDGTTVGPLITTDVGGPTGAPLLHTYSAAGPFSVSLLAHGESSINAFDDTLLKSNYLTVLAPPAPPANLSTKSISLNSVGMTPMLVAAATNNTVPSSMPAAGTAVTRITTIDPIETTEALNAYNASTGTLQAVINGIAETAVPLTGGNEVGTYGSLVITADQDAHNIAPTVYPSNFYTVFSGKISKSNASVPVGFNSFRISHSITGSTNAVRFVKDDVLSVPTIDISTAIATTTNLGAPKYISGVPYFSSGGTIAISNASVYNWIGQTYIGTTGPMVITPAISIEGAGSVIATQPKSYADLDKVGNSYLAAGIPIANTGKTSATPYSLGDIPVSINGSVAATGRISLQLSNVNGSSSAVTLPKLINVYAIPVVGFDETSIPVSASLGGAYTDNGARVFIPGAVGSHPAYLPSTDYFTTSPFVGPINVEGTDEAITRFGTLAHNQTDYSTYLPEGPNCSNRPTAQYFRFAFRRTLVANFNITYSGKISGITIAAPGTAIDNTSSLNGWLDANLVYAGAGTPGANTAAGGNGSNGCAKTAGDKIPVGQLVTNHTCTLTLGNENSSNAFANEILVSIELNAGDSITAISIS